MEQTRLAIDYAPRELRMRGYHDAPYVPKVGLPFTRGPNKGKVLTTEYRQPEEAWEHIWVQHNPLNRWQVMVFDCDNPLEATVAVASGKLPQPSWRILNPESEHYQYYYVLKYPVHIGKGARSVPVKLAGEAYDYFREVLKADRKYQGKCMRSISRTPGPGGELLLGQPEGHDGFTLDELRGCVPVGYRPEPEPRPAAPVRAEVPEVIRTGQRNESLFALGMEWAGRYGNRHIRVIEYLREVNRTRCAEPLAEAELQDIARSVERYRRQFDWEQLRERQAERGRASGRARNGKLAARNAQIEWLAQQGASLSEICGVIGMMFPDLAHSKGAIRNILRRRNRVLLPGLEQGGCHEPCTGGIAAP